MIFFGHIGITLGASAVLANVLMGSRMGKTVGAEMAEPPSSSPAVTAAGEAPGVKASWFAALGNVVDIRLVLIGAMLPDIIDKPVGVYFFREAISNGRIYLHSLLFLVLTTVVGYLLYKFRGKTYLLAIALGVLFHLILDQIWNLPRTLFWPFLGFTYDRIDLSDWIPNILHTMLRDPATYIPELVGIVILAWFAFTLWRRGMVWRFIRSGRMQ